MKQISKRTYDLILLILISLAFVLSFYFFLGTNRPEGHFIHTSGIITFILLSYTLSLGPLTNIYSSLKPLLIHRRHTGIITVSLASIHGLFAGGLLTEGKYHLLFISYFNIKPEGIPHEWFGFTAWLILCVLAFTSNNFFVSKLAESWKFIHLLVYPAFFLAILHILFGPVLREDGEIILYILYPFLGLLFSIQLYSLHLYELKFGKNLFKNKEEKDSYLELFLSETKFLEDKIKDSSKSNQAKVCNIILDFVGERKIQADSTKSLLENALDADIPHIFECGGNARCSTCRVLILEGLEYCNHRNEAEKKLAIKKGLDDTVRLACQTYSDGDLKLKRLVFDKDDIEEIQNEGNAYRPVSGKEKKMAVLFSDIRSFTPFTESNLPYDVVHMLNKYFNTIGAAIHKHRGYIDKYMGDGIMVLFGLDESRTIDPCVDAVLAAKDMLKSLEEVNQYLKEHFHHTFSIGIGIHFGPVIIGKMGFHMKMEFTALGDTVNLASRIESKTKDLKAEILVSKDVYERI
ncbi:MAG: ferric reductase-like transmembrane domain-containing protein, partial [Leptospiraceae bacterium]|nr:ferric reductase-like transmembrane domain-containing protein [Leptospiraceae bacterium]